MSTGARQTAIISHLVGGITEGILVCSDCVSAMRGDNPKIQQCAGKRVPVGDASVKISSLELCLWN